MNICVVCFPTYPILFKRSLNILLLLSINVPILLFSLVLLQNNFGMHLGTICLMLWVTLNYKEESLKIYNLSGSAELSMKQDFVTERPGQSFDLDRDCIKHISMGLNKKG